MDAKVRELWLIVECPHCLRPQVFRKHVMENTVISLTKTRYMTCEFCGDSFFIELEEKEVEV